MKKLILILMLVIISVSACGEKQDADTEKALKLIEHHKTKYDAMPATGTLVDGVRVIDIVAQQFDWAPDPIIVNKGEKIRFVVDNVDVPHGFEIEGLTIPGWDEDTPIVKGEKVEMEIVAEQAGTWQVSCPLYCGPGHGGMKGKYVVRE